MAPSDFGIFSHHILVGQLGSGEILAFEPITIDGLSALSVGNDGSGGLATALFFTAGPNAFTDGLFGAIRPNAPDELKGNGE